jgi:hypothetical protein
VSSVDRNADFVLQEGAADGVLNLRTSEEI